MRKGKPASTPTKTGLVTRAKSNDFAFGIRTGPLFVTLADFYCPFWADNVIPKKHTFNPKAKPKCVNRYK